MKASCLRDCFGTYFDYLSLVAYPTLRSILGGSYPSKHWCVTPRRGRRNPCWNRWQAKHPYWVQIPCGQSSCGFGSTRTRHWGFCTQVEW